MKLLFAFLADSALSHADGKIYVIGGGVEMLSGPEFPLRHPNLSLVVKLQFSPAECGRTHPIEVQGLDSDAKPFGPTLRVDATPQRNSQFPTRPVGVQFVLNMQNIQIDKPGDYVFSILVGGEERGTVPLSVSKSALPPLPEASEP